MTELDCTDIETALRSLSEILCSPIHCLRQALSAFDDSGAANEQYLLPDRLLRATIGPVLSPRADSIIWFHATRVRKDVTFCNGLLPTREARPILLQWLCEIASNIGICTMEEWPEIQKRASAAPNLLGKSVPALGPDAGPSGFLIREGTIAHGSYYLDGAEKVQEFCSSLGKQGDQLHEAYKAETRPAIVKFRSTKASPCAISTAIEYAYLRLIGSPYDCPCAWSGEGTAVPASDILGIEYVG